MILGHFIVHESFFGFDLVYLIFKIYAVDRWANIFPFEIEKELKLSILNPLS